MGENFSEIMGHVLHYQQTKISRNELSARLFNLAPKQRSHLSRRCRFNFCVHSNRLILSMYNSNQTPLSLYSISINSDKYTFQNLSTSFLLTHLNSFCHLTSLFCQSLRKFPALTYSHLSTNHSLFNTSETLIIFHQPSVLAFYDHSYKGKNFLPFSLF